MPHAPVSMALGRVSWQVGIRSRCTFTLPQVFLEPSSCEAVRCAAVYTCVVHVCALTLPRNLAPRTLGDVTPVKLIIGQSAGFGEKPRSSTLRVTLMGRSWWLKSASDGRRTGAAISIVSTAMSERASANSLPVDTRLVPDMQTRRQSTKRKRPAVCLHLRLLISCILQSAVTERAIRFAFSHPCARAAASLPKVDSRFLSSALSVYCFPS